MSRQLGLLVAITAVVVAVVVTGCAANVQTIQLVNRTSRPIEEIYIYPSGAANHGASRTSLAPNATAQVKVAAGHVEVLAVSAKVNIDAHTRERPTATQGLELAGPLEVVFFDADAKPAELSRRGTVGVAFVIGKPSPPPAPPADGAPAPPP